MPGAGTLFDVMEGCGEGSEANPGSGRGDILMKFPPFLRAFDYLILDTDHDSFVSIYSCTPLFFGYAKWELGWVMTRKQNPDKSVVSKTEGFETKWKSVAYTFISLFKRLTEVMRRLTAPASASRSWRCLRTTNASISWTAAATGRSTRRPSSSWPGPSGG